MHPRDDIGGGHTLHLQECTLESCFNDCGLDLTSMTLLRLCMGQTGSLLMASPVLSSDQLKNYGLELFLSCLLSEKDISRLMHAMSEVAASCVT